MEQCLQVGCLRSTVPNYRSFEPLRHALRPCSPPLAAMVVVATVDWHSHDFRPGLLAHYLQGCCLPQPHLQQHLH